MVNVPVDVEKRKKVAYNMTRQTEWFVTAHQVVCVSDKPEMEVYAAQVDDVTIMCWVHQDGKYIVKHVSW